MLVRNCLQLNDNAGKYRIASLARCFDRVTVCGDCQTDNS